MKSKMDVDNAFKTVGNFGKFQFLCFVSLVSINLLLAWQMVQLVFVGADPVLNASSHEVTAANSMKTIVSEWNLYKRKWVCNSIQSIFMCGVMIGNFIFGQFSDLYGRKYILNKVFGLLIVSSFVSSFSNNYVVYGAIRFFVGVFQGGTVLITFVLAQELLGSSVWTITGNMMPALFALGIASLAGIASSCADWRQLSMVTSLPGVVLWLAIIYVPESPRWLFSQGKVNEAEKVLRSIAAKNGVSPKECNGIALQKQEMFDKGKKTYSVRDLFSLQALMIRTLVMGYLWFVCSFTYYGLTMGAGDLSSNIYTSVALSGLVELPAYAVCAFLIDRRWAGRKKTLAGMLLICGIACIAIMFVHIDKTTGTSATKLGLALSGKLAVSAAFSIVYIYASELYPTVVRNVGMGSSSVCARVGGIFAPFVPTLSQFGQPLPYLVFGFVALVAGFLTFLLPETLHQPIPNTIEEISSPRTKTVGIENLAFTSEEESIELLK